ncbi:MAG: sulfatase-like hydrolase/transferase [Desulfobacterales bacterium]|nr:sulfatase-like hydrolase/transferase [Desulfobacterales bacterium]
MRWHRKVFKWVGFASYFLVISSLLFFMVYRARGVWSFIHRHTGRHEPVFLNILNNDAIVAGVVLLLMYLGFFQPLVKSIKWLASLLKSIVIFIILFYGVDAWMLLNIIKRLQYRDILKYGAEINAGLSFLAPVKAFFLHLVSVEIIGGVLVGVLFLLAVSFILFQFSGRCQKAHGRLLLIGGIGFLIFSFIPMDRIFLHGWAYESIFAHNMPKGYDQPYSDAFIAAAREKGETEKVLSEGAGKRPHIILLVVESLSSCHGRFFSGVHDYTPRLDAIAKENLSLVNFFANGFATEHGLIALLLGEAPLPAVDVKRRGAFQGYDQGESTAVLLKKAGYRTCFLTTGDLSFTNKGEWLKRIGFEEVEGSETPFYKGWPRFAFNAAPDEALYAYAMKKIAGLNTDERPYFMVLETVTSHLPFLDPEGRANTEESVIGYVDRRLGLFYGELEDSGFFRDGVLIITSDHRVMAPLSKAELDLYGDSAFARIPMVVASGGERKGRIDAFFQQTDLYSSLQWLVSGRYERDPWDGNFLAPRPTPPVCIIKHMASDAELVYARCGSEEGYIKLQGDATRLLRGNIDPGKAEKIIERINRARIPREKK